MMRALASDIDNKLKHLDPRPAAVEIDAEQTLAIRAITVDEPHVVRGAGFFLHHARGEGMGHGNGAVELAIGAGGVGGREVGV